jgi:hypothetical protein
LSYFHSPLFPAIYSSSYTYSPPFLAPEFSYPLHPLKYFVQDKCDLKFPKRSVLLSCA